MQNNFTALQGAIEKAKKVKRDYPTELQKIMSDQNISESYRDRKKAELLASTNKAIDAELQIFSKNIEELRGSLSAASDTWKNADEPALASTLSLIQMGIQPSEAMIAKFRGDFVSMEVLSKALAKNSLYDSTEPYRLTKGVDYSIDEIALSFEFGVKDISGYSVASAIKGLSKLADIVGCEFKTETIDYFVAGAKIGGGLNE